VHVRASKRIHTCPLPVRS